MQQKTSRAQKNETRASGGHRLHRLPAFGRRSSSRERERESRTERERSRTAREGNRTERESRGGKGKQTDGAAGCSQNDALWVLRPSGSSRGGRPRIRESADVYLALLRTKAELNLINRNPYLCFPTEGFRWQINKI